MGWRRRRRLLRHQLSILGAAGRCPGAIAGRLTVGHDAAADDTPNSCMRRIFPIRDNSLGSDFRHLRDRHGAIGRCRRRCCPRLREFIRSARAATRGGASGCTMRRYGLSARNGRPPRRRRSISSRAGRSRRHLGEERDRRDARSQGWRRGQACESGRRK